MKWHFKCSAATYRPEREFYKVGVLYRIRSWDLGGLVFLNELPLKLVFLFHLIKLDLSEFTVNEIEKNCSNHILFDCCCSFWFCCFFGISVTHVIQE